MGKIYEKAMTEEEIREALKDDPVLAEEPGPTAPATIQEELERADKLYGEAVNYAKSFMDNVREGKPFDFQDATPLVNDLIDSVFRNDSATAAISKLKAFDEYTYTHCINVSVLAVILGKRLGYSREKLEMVGMAGMFHDVGKAIIPPHILNKPGALTDKEMDVMRTHPVHGYKLLKEQPDIPEEIIRGAMEHHEKHDGSGYPRGLKGEQISEIARLLAVVDVYDALTSKRVYKDPLPPGKVLAMMYKWRVTDFYPDIVEQFIKSLGVYPVGSFVRLSTGEHGVVTDHSPEHPLNPVVRICYDERMRPELKRDVNLAEDPDLRITDVINPDEHGVDIFKLIQ
ncbi:HD domain-containing protein [Pseudodesulfovibrio cashew]|uniref:HD domain-containing protein n=1 Tax=Pseudodesulfovibrio cashew TaxID=2678688 RepID=A0A6I6JE94_9BACT|nr:HD-GYP domain-containing protein [Pseudodesulfovibrio cashew]QGY39489.1 HD domain-containing protein [Pseudodesulfovibrio cashew]